MIWRPDTCGCRLEFDGINDKDHFTRCIERCPAHEALTDEEIMMSVLAENKTKNRVLHHILESTPSHAETFVDGDGNEQKRFKQGFQPTIEFNDKREIVVRMGKANESERASMRNTLAARLSSDPVLQEHGRIQKSAIE